MRSSSGVYFAGLDHIRGLAAFLVVTWHFAHWASGSPVPFNQAPALGFLDEGHVGVAVFMCLSGYLFAKLIGDRQIRYGSFLWNRALRLFPLLAVVLAAHWLFYRPPLSYLQQIISGAILPTLPNGGWSITAECHFYLVMPFALMALKRDPRWALAFLAGSLTVRSLVPADQLQSMAYYTIVGRIDQFILGIAAFRIGASGKQAIFAGVIFIGFYAWFDSVGGFYNGPQRLWHLIPTIEGLTISTVIAWYDRHPLPDFWILRKAGEYSYSIYLIHFFVVSQAAHFIDQRVMHIPSLYLALPWAAAFFVGMMGIGAVSWHIIERPALRLRRPYLV